MLVMTGFPCNRPELVYFVNSLTKKISLMVCGHIIEVMFPCILEILLNVGIADKYSAQHTLKKGAPVEKDLSHLTLWAGQQAV